MTISHRISVLVLAMLAALGVTFGAAWVGYQSARADDTAMTTPAQPDAGSASAPSSSAPADKLADPVANPAHAWDDLKAAKKSGWAVAAFAALLMLAKLAGRLGKSVTWLAVLGRGKVAVVVGAVGALATACYNAAVEGGAWSAVLIAGAVALFGYLDLGEKAETS